MDPQKKLFRSVALERLSTPERLDELMQVTTPRSWLGLVALTGLLVAALAWGILGSLPTVVKGQGIILRDGAIQTVETQASGQLTDLFVQVGDDVRQDQVIARIFQEGDASREGGTSRAVLVTSPHAGRVLETRVTRGNVLQAGTTLLSLEVGGRSLEAILFLPPGDGKRVRPGMDVNMAPSSVKKEEYGMLIGRVATVGELPASQQGMQRILGNEELAKQLSQNGAPIEVRVELARNPLTPSGFQWTSTLPSVTSWALFSSANAVGSGLGWGLVQLTTVLPPEWAAMLPADPTFQTPPEWESQLGAPTGPPVQLESGTPVAADVIVDQEAPIYQIITKFSR